jgi:hypothetical protein
MSERSNSATARRTVKTILLAGYVNGREIVEIVFPAPAYKGECLGVCEVPANTSVEEALKFVREPAPAIKRPVPAYS